MQLLISPNKLMNCNCWKPKYKYHRPNLALESSKGFTLIVDQVCKCNVLLELFKLYIIINYHHPIHHPLGWSSVCWFEGAPRMPQSSYKIIYIARYLITNSKWNFISKITIQDISHWRVGQISNITKIG